MNEISKTDLFKVLFEGSIGLWLLITYFWVGVLYVAVLTGVEKSGLRKSSWRKMFEYLAKIPT